LNGTIKNLKEDSSPGEVDIHNRFIKRLPSKSLDFLLKVIDMFLGNFLSGQKEKKLE
jgi:hypothetical protein